jgi:hypothetical protein
MFNVRSIWITKVRNMKQQCLPGYVLESLLYFNYILLTIASYLVD